jgi:hypothetical protein
MSVLKRTIVLSVILYRYEIWSLTSREVCALRVLQNRVLREEWWGVRLEKTA